MAHLPRLPSSSRSRSRSFTSSTIGRATALATFASLASLASSAAFESEAHASPSTTSPEQGYDVGDMQSPRMVGMAGATSALGTSTSALYMNPANLPISRVYHFEGVAAVSPEARRQTYGGAVVDSTTSKLAGGFSGLWSQQDPDGLKRTWLDFRLGLGLMLGDKVSIGTSLRYLRATQLVAGGPFGASLASDGTSDKPIYNGLTFDLGLTASLGEIVKIGIVGRNLTNPGTVLAPTMLGGGIGVQKGIVGIEADGFADLTTWGKAKARLMLGGEVFVANHFPIRAGYRFDQGQRAHAASLGFGYVDTKFSVELSGRRDIVSDTPSTMISLGLRYFYESAKSQPDEPDNF